MTGREVPEDRVGRLFFALVPDSDRVRAIEAATAARRAAVARAGARLVAIERLHLTLLYLGAVAERPALEAGGRVRASALRLVLERFGYFPRSGAFWLAPRSSARLEALNGALRAAMTEVAPEIRLETRPFQPHVTLARGLSAGPARADYLSPALIWPVSSFFLLASRDGDYVTLGLWPLEDDSATG